MSSPDAHSRLIAALADRYRIDREAGRGGMATVFLAEDVKHGRPVAVKVLDPSVTATVGPARFLREIRIAANLSHSHIVPVYDSGEVAGFLYYVMPHMAGESLRDRLRREGSLPIGEAVEITREVASALAYAHAQSVVHRDVKPENILLHEGEAWVTDFGIALARGGVGADRLTETGVAVGTPAYMSPEHITGDREIDARSDVYSLGCVLYEMLTGEPPHTGSSAQAVVAKALSQRPADVDVLRPAVSARLKATVHRAVERDPADRFASAAEFRTALQDPELLPRGRERPFRWVAFGVLLASALGVAGWWMKSGPRGPATGEGRPLDPARIAVLYFEDFTPGAELGHLADGFTEALIHELSQVGRLDVISRNGVKPYRDSNVPTDSIVAALSAGTLVEGSLEQSGDRLRVTVQLVDGATDTHLLSRRVERQGGDLLAMRDEIVEEVAALLRQRLGQEIRVRQMLSGAASDVAWELVQRGRRLGEDAQELWQRGDTQAARRTLARADSVLSAAEQRAPGWAEPTVSRGRLVLARRYWAQAIGLPRAAVETILQEGLELAARASELDPDGTGTRALRGTLRRYAFEFAETETSADTLFAGAEEDLRAALEADPSRADVWNTWSWLLQGVGRFQESRQAAERALAADPFLLEESEVLQRLCATSLELEDDTEARRSCDEGRRRYPDEPFFVYLEFFVLASEADPDVERAWSLLDTLEQVAPIPATVVRQAAGRLLVAVVLASAGLPDSAMAVADEALADRPGGIDLEYLEADLRTRLGQGDEALAILKRYVLEYPAQRRYVANDVAFRELRNDPRFRAIVGGR
jgi:TolB-like protein